MYIVTNKSQKMFFINSFILGRSGVKDMLYQQNTSEHCHY